MKTAIVPNSPELTTLMKANAELSVSLELFEAHCQTAMRIRMDNAAIEGQEEVINRFPDLSDQQHKMLGCIIRDAVAKAVTDVNAYIGVHERALGLVGEQAPYRITEKAIQDYHEHTKQYWQAVSD